MIAYIEDRLPVAPDAVPLARHALAVSLLPDLGDETLDTILLLTTEVVSRAITSTDDPWLLRVDLDDDDHVVRVSVRYRARPATGGGDDDELRDVILDAMSTSWGLDVASGLTTLWFEVA